MRYSPSKGCFYPETVDYSADALPNDLITVSDDDYRSALAREPGSTFSFNAKGKLTIDTSIKAPNAFQAAAAKLKEDAADALHKSDVTVLRCFEHGITTPDEWVAYRAALREVVQGTRHELPDAPPFPSNT